ncbi:MAG: LytR C-terminal domain-containing protein [Patescibacteria group bacterium]
MLHRSRVTAHPLSSNRSRKTVRVAPKKRTQKILKNSRSRTRQKHSEINVSYLFRLFLSGLAVMMVMLVVVFLKGIMTNSLDTHHSFTFVIRNEEMTDPQIAIVSLRGDDNSVSYSLVDESNGNVVQYFPIDAVIELDYPIALRDKASLLTILAPWNSEAHSELSFYTRLKIWRYVMSADSAHVQEHSVSTDDPTQLLSTVQKYYSDTLLRQLAPTIALINTTAENGLAKQVGDILSAWGFTVIQVDSTNQNPRDVSQLFVDPTFQQSLAVTRLQLTIPHLSVSQDDALIRSYRSQLVLFLGTDYQPLGVEQ